MAYRTVAIYGEEQIGIESIYTLSKGKQINIPGRVEYVRKLGQENKLFCPCGCGNNLILVAGDKNLREQHFRIKKSSNAKECTAAEEGLSSIHSKIILKCWIESKIESNQIESRVPVNQIYATERKYEYSFYDFKNKIGFCYWYERLNVETEKVTVIEELAGKGRTLYIVDSKNADTNGQYPEFMNKIQQKQGYVLYLRLGKNESYEDTELIVKVYHQRLSGDWIELMVSRDKLDNYAVLTTGKLKYRDCCVSVLAENVIATYKEEEKRIEEERREKERLEEERRVKLEKNQKEQQQLKENTSNFRKQPETGIVPSKETKKSRTPHKTVETDEKYAAEIEGIKKSSVIKQKYMVVDSHKKIWYCCKHCGKVARASDMHQYGVRGTVNLSVCKECKEINAAEIRKKIYGQ